MNLHDYIVCTGSHALGLGLLFVLAGVSTVLSLKGIVASRRQDPFVHEEPVLDLKQKYARGEITHEEYQQALQALTDSQTDDV